MIKWIATLIAATPIYPHWLEFRRLKTLQKQLISLLHGSVIEVGAGDCDLKREVLSTNILVSRYVATDFSGWDDAFEQGNILSRSNKIIEQLYLRRQRDTLDKICSALDLPFDDESFDCHISTEVLEHIPDPQMFFSEAARVLKRGGKMILTAPFLYRIHPDKNSDYFRVLPGGYAGMSEKSGLIVEQVISNTGIWASCAALVNQKIIINYFESKPKSIKRVVYLLLMPFLFAFNNLFGLMLDGKNPDSRFATRFLVVLKKI